MKTNIKCFAECFFCDKTFTCGGHWKQRHTKYLAQAQSTVQVILVIVTAENIFSQIGLENGNSIS